MIFFSRRHGGHEVRKIMVDTAIAVYRDLGWNFFTIRKFLCSLWLCEEIELVSNSEILK